MVRLLILVTCTIFIFEFQGTKAEIKYGIEDAINDIGSVVPGAKFVLTTAVKLWLLYGEVENLVHPNSTVIQQQLDVLNEKIDLIISRLHNIENKIDAVAQSVKDVKQIIQDRVVMELPKGINLHVKVDSFAKLKTKIKTMYRQYRQYTDKSKKFAKDTILKFADALVDPHVDQLTSILEQMKDLMVDTSGSFNMIDLLANEYLPNTLVCSGKQSPLHQINGLYDDAMTTELRGLILIQWAYATKRKMYPGDSYQEELKLAEETSFVRMLKIQRKVRDAMLRARQDYWTCDLADIIEDETFAKIGPVFQKYIIKELDIEDNEERFFDFLKSVTCPGSCAERTKGKDLCKDDYCKGHRRPCSGQITDCQSFHSDLSVCLADKNNDRRYKYLEAIKSDKETKKIYGWKQDCPEKNMISIGDKSNWLRPGNLVCEYCLCNCIASDEETDIDRYIGLEDVLSDVQNNKIVTGVKFIKQGRAIHIQIMQGTFKANGSVNQNSVDWKPIDKNVKSDYSNKKNYHTITWEERTVNLDDLKTREGNVLTGLRFKKVNNGVSLEIHVTPFDFATGKLDGKKSTWISNPDNTPRTELNLKDRDLPKPKNYRYLDSHDKQFFKFTTSSMENDAGQTVVPYIDLLPVSTVYNVLVSGAALIHKSNMDSAGFLALKLFTYNYASHLEK